VTFLMARKDKNKEQGRKGGESQGKEKEGK
jgi:hypothetical protein